MELLVSILPPEGVRSLGRQFYHLRSKNNDGKQICEKVVIRMVEDATNIIVILDTCIGKSIVITLSLFT
jgi:hypothetical protein